MKSNIRDLFTFSSGERKGVIVLIIILIMIGGFNLIVILHRPSGDRASMPEWMQDTEATVVPVSVDIRASKPQYRPGPGTLVDISHADSAQLEKLPGIGPVLARRIIRYRNLLGGYHSTCQIREVYGISDSLFHRIESRIKADSNAIIKINVNNAAEKELARHPYIGKFAAAAITRYREKVSGIKDIRELKTNGLISEDVFGKLKKYLTL